jgi:small-conductance mechanosensitive channel
MKKLSCVLALAFAFAGPGLAQDAAAPTGEQPAPEPEVPAELSTSDIAVRADDISAMLLEIQKMVEVEKPGLAKIPDQITVLEDDAEEALRSVSPETIDELSRSDAEIRLQTFRRMERELSAWRGSLQSYADELDKQGRKIKEQKDFTDALLAGDRRDDMPDALLERVGKVDAAMDATQLSVRNKLDGVLAELTRISSLKLRIDDAIQTIEGSQKQAEREAFGFDREPIWDAKFVDPGFRDRLASELRSRLDSVVEFERANRSGIIVLLILLIVIVGGTLAARPAIIRRAEESELDLVQRAFIDRPIALAVLLWVVLGPEALLTRTPLAIGIVRGLIVAVALWRMLPVIVDVAKRKYVMGLLFLFVANALLEVVPSGDVGLRIALLAISAAGIFFFTGFRDALKTGPRDHKTLWWRLGIALSVVAPPVLLACVVGLVVGAVGLAGQLITTLLVLAVVLLAIVVIEDTLMATAHFFVTGWGREWLRSIRRYPDLAKRRLDTLIRLGMLLIFITFLPRISVLLQFAYDWFGDFLTTDFTVGSVDVSLAAILGTIAGVVIAVYVARFIRFTLDEDVFPRLPIATGAASAASRLIYYGLVTGGILFALAASGVELSRLTLVISALGVGIGFGLQGIVNNFVSGLVLAFERPFQVGDIIEVGLLTGRVREIGLRASRVRTFDGAEVIVPNADLIAGNVINWTLSDRMRRLDIKVGVAYGTDPARVREILLAIAVNHEVVAKNPEPAALFNQFGESSLDFTLRIWIPEAGDWPQIASDLNESINAALHEAGIVIPFPQRTLHIQSDERKNEGD